MLISLHLHLDRRAEPLSLARMWLHYTDIVLTERSRTKRRIDYLVSLTWSQEPAKLIFVAEVRRVVIFVERGGGPQKSLLGTGSVVVTQVCTYIKTHHAIELRSMHFSVVYFIH